MAGKHYSTKKDELSSGGRRINQDRYGQVVRECHFNEKRSVFLKKNLWQSNTTTGRGNLGKDRD